MFLRCVRFAACVVVLAGAASTAHAFKLERTPGALSRTVVPQAYTVEFDADPYATTFSGRGTIQFDVRKATRELTLHASGLSLQASGIDGRSEALPVALDTQAQTATIRFPAPLTAGRHTLALAWSGELDENGEGLYIARYRTPDGTEKRMLATQMEPISARRMMPVFDEPAFRARFAVAVSTPARLTVLGNMPVASETILPDGRRRVRFAPTPKMPSYLLALAIGELEATRVRHDGIDLAVWTTEGQRQNAAYALAATEQILDYYHAYFGIRYPLPKLDQIAVPGMRGAMENWGLITYGEDLLLIDPGHSAFRQLQSGYSTIAHEIAHQWFGNLVTMAWWDDLWLNEAFAEWMGVKASRLLNPDWLALDTLLGERDDALGDDALSTAKPIARPVTRDTLAFDSFDSTTYNKGHMVVGLIEQYLGEDSLRDGIRDYLAQHAYSNATGAELWDALARRSGKPVRAFAEAWTLRPGHPTVFAARTCEQGQERITLRQARYGFGAVAGEAVQWPVPLQFAGRDGALRQRVDLSDTSGALEGAPCRAMRSAEPSPFDLWRLAWDETTQADLLARYPMLSSEQRARLLGDAWALAQTGDAPFEWVVAQLDALPVSDTPQAWSVATGVMREVRALARGEALAPGWDARVRGWLAPLAERLAALPADQRGQPVFAILAGEVDALRGLAGDPAILALARQQLALAQPTVDRDRFIGLIGVLALHGSDEEFAALLARFHANRDAGLAWAYAHAVTRAHTPETIRQVLALSLSDDIPHALQSELPGWVAANGHPREAWDFTRANLDALLARSSEWGRRYVLLNPLHGTRDTALAAEVEAYVRSRMEREDAPPLEQALATTARNAEAWSHIAGPLAHLINPPLQTAADTGDTQPETTR